jgi:hypothetical protein
MQRMPPIVIKLPEFEGMDPKILSSVNSTEVQKGKKTCNRKQRNMRKFHDKTAGIIAAVRPCGIIVNTHARNDHL